MANTLYSHNHAEGKCEHAPIRGSIMMLIAKILVILLLFELVYGAIFYVLTIGTSLPFNLHHHIAVVIFGVELLKILTQVILIANVTLLWANNTFYIDGKHLIKRTGIINVREDIYEFDSVRSLTVDQSWMGRIFHYGDVVLKASASGGYEPGGYQVIVTITGIQNPQKYEQMIKQCL